jgi:hypothetical protein
MLQRWVLVGIALVVSSTTVKYFIGRTYEKTYLIVQQIFTSSRNIFSNFFHSKSDKFTDSILKDRKKKLGKKSMTGVVYWSQKETKKIQRKWIVQRRLNNRVLKIWLNLSIAISLWGSIEIFFNKWNHDFEVNRLVWEIVGFSDNFQSMPNSMVFLLKVSTFSLDRTISDIYPSKASFWWCFIEFWKLIMIFSKLWIWTKFTVSSFANIRPIFQLGVKH